MMVNSDFLGAMISKAQAAMQHAYAPIDDFKVGCCLRTEDGFLYSGCNIEISPINLTLCAETVAIGKMISEGGEKKISDIVVMANKVDVCPPCGVCRQRLLEFATPNLQVYLCDKEGAVKKIFALTYLIPEPFLWK